MIKQVIVIRTKYPDGDGGTRGIRRGKEIAQCCHASMAFLIKGAKSNLKEWLEGGQTKICVAVTSEEELVDVFKQAKTMGLEAHIITDAGRTEFGEPTKTAVAIGPDKSDKIDKITGHLPLR